MVYIIILVCIPIFFVGLTMYTYTMFDFMFNNNLDVALLLVSLFATLLTSYLTLKELSLLDGKTYKMVKFQSRVDSIIGIISCTLLFVFGVSLLVNTSLHGLNYSKLLIGVAIAILYLYIIYMNFINRKIEVFKIISIDKISDKVYSITLENKEEGLVEMYSTTKDNIKKSKFYKCSYNKFNKQVLKILNEVIDVK